MATDPGIDRRRSGSLLVAYGVVGIILLSLLAIVTVYAAVRATDSLSRLDARRDNIVLLLDHTAQALSAAEDATTGVSSSLSSTSDALASASELATLVSGGANRLADSAGISILGQQPFAGFTDDLRQIAGQTQQLAMSLGQTAGSLQQNSEDVTTLGQKIGVIAEDVAGIRTTVADLDLDFGSWIWLAAIVGLVLIGWLAVPAVAALWIGRRWRRQPAAPGPA